MSNRIQLPSPAYKSECDVNRALHGRRASREYTEGGISLAEVAQLLWSAQGVTTLGGFRTAPSAGGLYPLETYVVVGVVDDLAPGVYRYVANNHTLKPTVSGDKREALAAACLGQNWLASAPVILVFSAVYERTTSKYGDRGKRYVHMEVGHAGQNVSLSAVAMGLGAVVVAAFDDDEVKGVLELPAEENPLYVMPIGRK